MSMTHPDYLDYFFSPTTERARVARPTFDIKPTGQRVTAARLLHVCIYIIIIYYNTLCIPCILFECAWLLFRGDRGQCKPLSNI